MCVCIYIYRVQLKIKTHRRLNFHYCAQIENEYGNIESSYGDAGQKYVNWIADMAVATNASVPWIMCQQRDAPQYIV